jgi:hypothetical protein
LKEKFMILNNFLLHRLRSQQNKIVLKKTAQLTAGNVNRQSPVASNAQSPATQSAAASASASAVAASILASAVASNTSSGGTNSKSFIDLTDEEDAVRRPNNLIVNQAPPALVSIQQQNQQKNSITGANKVTYVVSPQQMNSTNTTTTAAPSPQQGMISINQSVQQSAQQPQLRVRAGLTQFRPNNLVQLQRYPAQQNQYGEYWWRLVFLVYDYFSRNPPARTFIFFFFMSQDPDQSAKCINNKCKYDDPS